MNYWIRNKTLEKLFKKVRWIPDADAAGKEVKRMEHRGLFMEHVRFTCLVCDNPVYQDYMVHNIIWTEIIYRAFTPEYWKASDEARILVDTYVNKVKPAIKSLEGAAYRNAIEELVNEDSEFKLLHDNGVELYKVVALKAKPFLRGAIHLPCFASLIEVHWKRPFAIEDLKPNPPINENLFFITSVIANKLINMG